jgi:hypothetical protein
MTFQRISVARLFAAALAGGFQPDSVFPFPNLARRERDGSSLPLFGVVSI